MAHDFWIEPLRFRAAAATEVPLRLLVGMDFKGEPALYLPEFFERYVHVDGGGERPVAGRRGDDPAGAVVVGDGLNVVGYHSKKFEVQFDSLDEFEAYLRQEGLERQQALARERGGGRILEIYLRAAKALIAGPNAAAAADRRLGFPIELIAETNPYRQAELRVRLLYRNRPLDGALVVAFNKADPTNKMRRRTDADGRATFTLARPGVWLVTSVHMIPRRWYERGDWESYWASLSFERPRR